MSLNDAESTVMSILCGAASTEEASRRVYLTRFCNQYNEPLVNYLRLARGIPSDTAEEVVQEFWMNKLITPGPQDNLISKYLAKRDESSEIGFRQYLGRSLKNFFIDQMRRQGRRVDNVALESLDHVGPQARCADVEFDEVWASHILNEVVTAVRLECDRQGQSEMWKLFVQVTLGKGSGMRSHTLADLATQYGFASAKQASNALQTISRKLKRAMRSRIANYLPQREGVDAEVAEQEEVQQLLQILSRPGSVSLESLLADSVSVAGENLELSLFEMSRTDVRFRLAHLAGTGSEYGVLWLTFLDQTLDPWLSKCGVECDPSWRSIRLADFASMSKPDRELLNRVRQEAKRLGMLGVPASYGGSHDLAFPAEFYAVIYHIAIAIARIQYDERITRSSDEELKRRIVTSLQHDWLDQRTAELFRDLLDVI